MMMMSRSRREMGGVEVIRVWISIDFDLLLKKQHDLFDMILTIFLQV